MQANRITSIYETLPAVLYQFPTGKAILIDWTNETFLQKLCARVFHEQAKVHSLII